MTGPSPERLSIDHLAEFDAFLVELNRAAAAQILPLSRADHGLVDKGGPYPTLDLERLLALDPEVILDGASDMSAGSGPSRIAALQSAPGWKELRAVRENRVRQVDASTALRPGPRIGQGLIAMARALHGEAIFSDTDVKRAP